MDERSGELLLTYAELAERLGIGVDGARIKAKRRGWPVLPGNDGRSRVQVSADELPERPPERTEQDDEQAERLENIAELQGELRRALARAERNAVEAAEARAENRLLREMLDRERALADELRAEVRALVVDARRPFWRRWVG